MPRSIKDASKKAGDMIHVSPAGAWAVMRRLGNFGSLACIEFVFPWHCNPRGVLLLGSTGNTCVTHTCLAQGKGAPLSRGCCRLPLGNVSFNLQSQVCQGLVAKDKKPEAKEKGDKAKADKSKEPKEKVKEKSKEKAKDAKESKEKPKETAEGTKEKAKEDVPWRAQVRKNKRKSLGHP